MKIGFIGQGWIGKNYADNFVDRGYSVVRYALEQPYSDNKDSIKECPIVFIAVPTPTTKQGFDDSYVRDALTVLVLQSSNQPLQSAQLNSYKVTFRN
jgi:predicted dinucleotide-binding enzyme